MTVEIRVLTPADIGLLDHLAEDLFDYAVNPALTAEFLADPRHHLMVGIDNGVIASFASAVHYVHPDKPAELWINEVSVAPAYQRQGVGKAVLKEMLALGRRLGCAEAWVLTDDDNAAARALYRAMDGVETSKVVMVSFALIPA